MKSKNIGIIIFTTGILYLIIASCLVSWWYVPDYRESGPGFITGSSWYTSLPYNIIWGISAPVGAILVIFGFSFFAGVERNRILFFAIGGIIILFWLAVWYVSSITSVLYGIGGSIIILCFLISVRSWAKKRPHLEKRNRQAADLRLLGLLFFLIAAWGLCGILGTPMFALRPELMIKYQTQYGAYTLGAKVIICLAAGWIFMAISQYLESSRSKNLNR